MITTFLDSETTSDHDRFQAWRTEHQDAAVLMLEPGSRARLHGVRCLHFGSGPPYFASGDGFGSLTSKQKLCGQESELIEWAAQNGIALKGCHHCVRDGLIAALDVDAGLDEQVAEAEAVLVRVLPDARARAIVLRRLLKSAGIAESAAPGAWGVTLFSNGFRLNVGQVEVLVLDEHALRANLIGQPGVSPAVGPRFEATTYRSMPELQCAFVGTVAEYSEIEGAITDAHEAFVRRAASTDSGQPRLGTPFRRSHHEGILEFCRRILGTMDDFPSRPPRAASENGQQSSPTKDTRDEPSFTYDDAFPVIARLILAAARSEPQRFVPHDAIVDLVLADRRGAEIVAQARLRSAWADDREAASNMVAWFSQQISVGRSEWLQLFERERINGAWAYRPAAFPRMGQSGDADIAVIEGEPRMFFHVRREREPRIVAAKRGASRNENGELQCEACGFVAQHAYSGFAGDIAEVHHRRPLAEATGPVETTLDDLAILCANCHRAIHQTRPMLTVDEFRVRFLSSR